MKRRNQNRTLKQGRWLASLLASGLLLFGAALPLSVSATTYYVGSSADTSSGGACTTTGNSDCSLREAVGLASAVAGDDTINVEVVGTITLTSGQIQGNNGIITLIGQGSSSTIIDGNANGRIFEAGWSSSGFNFQDIRLQNGSIANVGGCVKLTNQSTTITRAVFDSCTGTRGGAIFSDQVITVTVADSTFSNNTANNSASTGGGAIEAKGVSVTNSTFTGNTATGGTGRGGAIYSPTSVSVTGSTFSNNQLTTSGQGGAIYAVQTTTIATSTFNTNSTASGEGGAVYINNGGTAASITDSYFYNNNSTGDGGALRILETETTIIDGSTFESNSGGRGGAVASFNGPTTITNSTFSGNSGTTEAGAIRAGASTVTLNYSTFYNNSAGNSNSGGAVLGSVITTLGTIFSGNTSNAVANACGWSVVTSSGYNVDHSGECGFTTTTGDVTGDPLLQALADNGGPTKTHAVTSGPAVDGGPATCSAATGDVDQRGTARPQGSNCDIGAYEKVAAAGPTNTFTSGTYDSSTNTLVFTGTNFDTIDAVSTDIKTYMDWTKFSWDINGDNATTANINVAEADVTSLTITNATTLTLVFTTTKANTIEATTDAGVSGGADTLDITAGFSKSSGGTPATTDGLADGSFTIDNNQFNVTKTADTADGNCTLADCSLREAITAANADTSATPGAQHVINIPSGTYTITLTGLDYANATGDFDVKEDIRLVGAGAGSTTISGQSGGGDYVFQAGPNTISFEEMTITNNGNNSNLTSGGCVYSNGGTLSFTNTTVDSCKATNGGGVMVESGSGAITVTGSTFSNNVATNVGGAIRSWGMTVDSTSFIDNTSTSNGGAIFNSTGALTIQNSSVLKGNDATGGTGGGAIYAQTNLTITDSTFGGAGAGEGNTAVNGGAVFIESGNTLSIDNSSFIQNSVTNVGGAIRSWGLTIQNGATFQDNFANNDGGAIFTSSAVSINGDTLFDNNDVLIDDDDLGGAIYSEANVTLNDTSGSTIFQNNDAKTGGAVFMSAGTITGTNVTFKNNTGTVLGGALRARGMTFSKSTFSGNSTASGTSNHGGAIFNSGSITLTNTTFSSNFSGDIGGAIYADSSPSCSIINSTFYNNTAAGTAADTIRLPACTLTNNIITSNGSYNNCHTAGTYTSGGHNIENKNTCDLTGTGDQINTDPLLNTLADNGGVTETHSLQSGSPAIDNGDGTVCTSAPVNSEDQISQTRDSTCSVGAYEYQILANHVCASGCQYTTIQSAIDGSTNGDTITVHDGTYSENINFNAKVITLVSQNGAATTTIQGDGSNAPVVTFANSALTASTILDGFTINNSLDGGTASRGISITSSSAPTLKNLTLVGNQLDLGSDGGAVYIIGATATIQDSTIGATADKNQADQGAGIYISSPSAAVSISGTTFDDNYTDYQGGAVYIYNADTYGVTISNSSFIGNDSVDGAAIYIYSSDQTVTITNTDFTNNIATDDGGAVHGYWGANVDITGGTWTGNTATSDGGAIYIDNSSGNGSTLTISGGSYTNNTATNNSGGAIYTNKLTDLDISNATINSNDAGDWGGGLHLGNPLATATVTISNCSIDSNTSGWGGGGINIAPGSAAFSLAISSGTTVDSNVVNDAPFASYHGAGIRLSGTYAVDFSMTGGSISNNINYADSGAGGALYTYGPTSVTIDGTTMNGNSIDGYGGALSLGNTGTTTIDNSYIQGNSSLRDGGGIRINNGTTATITNTLISGNRVYSGSAYGGGIKVESSGVLNLYNSTIAGNRSDFSGGGIYSSGTETIRNSIIYGNNGSSSDDFSGTIDTESHSIIGIADPDPLFVDTQLATAGAATTAGDYRLCNAASDPAVGCASGPSPGIDGGYNTSAPLTDIIGESRPQGTAYDMGAYEYPAGPVSNSAPIGGYTASNVIPTAQVTQSSNGDGIITINFRAQDADTNNVTLKTFEYSVDGGSTWNAPTNGDTSTSLSTNWSDSDGAGTGYTSATDWTGTVHSFTFDTDHADVTGMVGVDQSDVQIRFTLTDGIADSTSPATSESFQVDNVLPTATITSAVYTAASDTLVITGTNFDTIAAVSTDIKSYVDWTKFVWDINGDDATTTDITLVVGDITSLTVTDATTLTLVLSGAKATALEGTTGFGGLNETDTLDVTAGFTIDAAGNVATTDGVANAPIDTGAVTYTVTKTADTLDGSCDASDCSLREAISAANANIGADTITVPAGTYTLTRTGSDNNNINGDLDITESVTINGDSITTTLIDGNAGVLNDRILNIIPGAATVSLNDLALQNANAGSGSGAGIYHQGTTLNLTRVAVKNNTTTGHGGGISSILTNTINLTDVEISGNSATGTGNGGGIYAIGPTIVWNGGLASGNSALNGGAVRNSSDFTATNVTFSGNTATSSGPAFTTSSGIVTLTNVTITNNSGFPAYRRNGGTINISNSIIGDNPGGNCFGTITSGGYNLETTTNTCSFTGTGDQNSVSSANLNMGVLASNGGLFQTHALAAGSFAIDQIPNTTNGCGTTITTDVRGTVRPQNSSCDVGAYEYSGAAGIIISGRLYDTDESTAITSADQTVRLYVNGSDSGQTDVTDGSGDYTFTQALSADDVITVYLEGETNDATTVTVTDGSTDITDLDIYYTHVIVRHDNAGSMTNTLLDTADGDGSNAEILFTSSGGTLTVDGGVELYIPSSHTFTPGGAIDAVGVDVRGTLDAAANAINVSGNWSVDAAATFISSGTVTFDGTQDQTITSNSKSFNNLTLANIGDEATYSTMLVDALTVSGTLTIDDGKLDTTGSNLAINTLHLDINGGNLTANGSTITVTGNVDIASVSGLFTKGTSTVDLTGTGTVANPDKNNAFHLLNVGAPSKITTVSSHTYTDRLHLGTGGLTRINSAEPHIGKGVSGQTIITSDGGDTTGSFFRINLYGTNNVSEAANAVTLSDVQFVLQQDANITLTGDITLDSMRVENDNASFSVGANNATFASGIIIGSSSAARSCTLNFGSQTVTFGDGSGINGNINGGTTNFNLESATINVGAVWWDMMSGVTVNPGTSTINFNRTNGDQTITSAGNSFNNLTINNSSVSGSDNVILADNLDINGNFTLTKGNFIIANYDIAIGGDINGGSPGSTIDGTGRTTGTCTLDGTGTQSITSGDYVFHNLIVSNGSGNAVSFVDAMSAINFTATTANTQLIFVHTTTHTISGTLDLNGQASDTKVVLRSSSAGTQFTLDITGGAQTVQYVDVQDSVTTTNDITCNYCTNSGNTDTDDVEPTDRWIFLTTTVSGTVYIDEGITTIADGATVRLIINGTSVGTSTTTTGAYSINATLSAGDAMIVYIDGDATYDGTTVSVSDGNSLAGLDIYSNYLITRHDNAGSLTNVLMSTALGAYSDTEILYTVDGGNNLTATAGTVLYTPASQTYAPGANVTAGHLKIANTGTVTAATHTLNVANDWTLVAGGTFNYDTSTVNLNGTAQTIYGSTTFYNLSKSVAAADTLTFEATQTTTIASNGTLTLSGAVGQLLTLASSTGSSMWNLVMSVTTTKVIDYVSVSWSDASGSDSTMIPIKPTNATYGGNTIAWSGPVITVTKNSSVISDPINNTTNPLRIPGAIIEYTIEVINSGDMASDADSTEITDVLQTVIAGYDVATGVTFTDGTTSSGLTLGTISYSNSGAPDTFTYTPVGPYDNDVAKIKITTAGSFAYSGTPRPSFIITYQVQIQ